MLKPFTALAAVLCLSVCAAKALAFADEAAPVAVVPDQAYAFRAETLAPGVHVLSVGAGFQLQPRGNVEVIEQARGVVLVDGGGSRAAAEEVIAFVRAQTRKRVTAIVITHWHGDHSLGVDRLLEEWPNAGVISTAPTQAMFSHPNMNTFMPGGGPDAQAAYMQSLQENLEFLRGGAQDQNLPETHRSGFARSAREYEQYVREMGDSGRAAPAETFEERLVLADRERPVEVLFLGRANTAGDAVVWLPRQRIVITGDVVVAPIPYGFNAYPADWIGVLERIKTLDYAVLAPGHGAPMRDEVYVDLLIAMLRDVRAQVAPHATTDLDVEGVAAQVNLDRWRDQVVGEDPWLRMWFRNYWKDPIVSSALREARGQPIVQGDN